MMYGPYIPVMKETPVALHDWERLSPGIYCHYYFLDRTSYAYYIVRLPTILKLEYIDGTLVWVTQYYNFRHHGVLKTFVTNGNTKIPVCSLYIHGEDYTHKAKDEGIDFDLSNDIAFMMLKYSKGG